MIRAVPSNASDNVYCTLLAQSAVHGAMAGYTGYISGLVNGRQTYIPFYVSHKIDVNFNDVIACFGNQKIEHQKLMMHDHYTSIIILSSVIITVKVIILISS